MQFSHIARIVTLYCCAFGWSNAGAESIGTSFDSVPDNLHFDVYLDDKKIGQHRFSFSAQEQGYRLVSEANYKVKFFGITFFDYQHRSEEQWQNGCLHAINSRTQSNDDEYSIRSGRQNEQLRITTQDDEFIAPSCTRTFAYWTPELLLQKQLLNSQTGELQQIDHSVATSEQGQLIKLRGEDIDIELDYRLATDSGQLHWHSLKAKLENGRTLAYKRAKLANVAP